MEDDELKNIWKEYDRRLEEARVLNLQSWALNLQSFEMLQRSKMESRLRRLARFKMVVMVLGLPWTWLMGWLFIKSLSWPSLFISLPVSVGAIFLFNLYALAAYVRHLVMIRQINNSENVADTQLKLARLQAAILHTIRILFWQLPFYTTFLYSVAWVKGWGVYFWLSMVPFTILFIFLSWWLYRNVNERNAGKKWFRFLFNGPEWNYVVQSVGFIREIESFKQNI